MCLFQVCRTNIFWAVDVFPEMSEQSYKVHDLLVRKREEQIERERAEQRREQ
jgi:hypothetical protein